MAQAAADVRVDAGVPGGVAGGVMGGLAAGIAAGALWGLVFVAPRMVPGLSSVDLAAGRFLAFGAASVVAMLWAAWGSRRLGLPVRLPTVQQALAALGFSVLGFTGYYLLLVLALRDAGVTVPTLIIGVIPLWVMVLGKPQGLRWRGLLPGVLLTVAGLGLMAQSELTAVHVDSPVHFWRGVLLAVLAMAAWTAFSLLNAAWLKRHPEVSATDWANWLGIATGLGALLLAWGAGTDSKVLLAQPEWALAAIVCIAMGVGSAWLATVLWNIASQRLSASLCGQLIVSETLFALLYAFLWDGHWPSAAQALACVLFTLGILSSVRAHRSP